jgi:uncharacterized protein
MPFLLVKGLGSIDAETEYFVLRPGFLCYHDAVSHKSGKIAAMIAHLPKEGWAPHYAGYFECFNQGLFYESHDVLEELWLQDRQGPNGNFYKGLIQFAGAFVHLQKHSATRPRLRPAKALFGLADANLRKYPALHEGLDLQRVWQIIDEWAGHLEASGFTVNPLDSIPAPTLKIEDVKGRSMSPGGVTATSSSL